MLLLSINSGQCGVGNKKVVLKPTKMKLDGAVVSASCGRAHTAVVTASECCVTANKQCVTAV
jgi:Regulator of chromosome condensation (RCC1) repeat